MRKTDQYCCRHNQNHTQKLFSLGGAGVIFRECLKISGVDVWNW